MTVQTQEPSPLGFGVSRQVAYVYFVFASISLLLVAIVEVQEREDFRGTVAKEKTGIHASIASGIDAFADVRATGSAAAEADRLRRQRNVVERVERKAKRLIEFGSAREEGTLPWIWDEYEREICATWQDEPSSERVSVTDTTASDGPNMLLLLARNGWFPLACYALLFGIYLRIFVPRSPAHALSQGLADTHQAEGSFAEQTDARTNADTAPRAPKWELIRVEVAAVLTFTLAGLSIAGTLHHLGFLSSNNLLALAMMCAGVLGVMSDLARQLLRDPRAVKTQQDEGTRGRDLRSVLAGLVGSNRDSSSEPSESETQATTKTAARATSDGNGLTSFRLDVVRAAVDLEMDRRLEEDRERDFVTNRNRGGLVSVAVGAVVGIVVFALIKSGKHVFLNQQDPSDVSLSPFSGVIAAYVLALFSPKYFKKLDEIARALLPASKP